MTMTEQICKSIREARAKHERADGAKVSKADLTMFGWHLAIAEAHRNY